MTTMTVRAVLCAALVLCGGSIARGGDLDRQERAAARGRACTFRVHPPVADAKLYFEGVLIRGTGLERRFRSPELEEGRHYAYTVLAVWVEHGREVTHEMHVKFWAGDDVVLNFRR